ncbi:MAG: DPP IV N-terminal domain-containing protein, partial [Burkholderiales bacterium]
MLNAHLRRAGAAAALVLISSSASAQGTADDYRRAMTLRDRYQGLALNVTDQTRWVQNTSRFVYRRTVKGGHEFVIVDAETRAKSPAFDHAKLAAALGTALGRKVLPLELPFTQFSFVDGLSTIEFTIAEDRSAPPRPGPAPAPPWRCTLADYKCHTTAPAAGRGRNGRGNGLAGPVRPTFDVNGAEAAKSPDGKLEALVNNFNIGIREVGSRAVTLLSTDGSEGSYYDPESIAWSPDSKRIAAYRIKPGFRRYVHYVESSPEDQLQPKHSTLQYAKPGDVLDVETPVIFHVDSKKQLLVDNALFPNPYDLSRLEWHKDGATVTFEYNQRGHQVYRVITIDADTGTARAVITEASPTFFSYSGKRFRHDVDSGREVIWMSERDGWNHLYLYDGATGALKTQITKGPWVVRGVVEVQDRARQIYFLASGMYPGKDPYFVHFYRINFDGTGLTALTRADANHTIALSPDAKLYVDTYSRVDSAPVTELRRSSDGSLVQEIERAEIDDLVRAGWTPPEVFVAHGRDGVTDIWGVIFRPTNFDPSMKYPVLENIYAGPQGAFVPKSFAAFNAMQAQAEIGFIVVQIDGMGTSHRSKAFHDVAWKNLKDAGFPDRVLWHKAVAARYPYYDIT